MLVGKLIEEINNNSFDHVFDRVVKIPAKMNSSFAPVSGNYFYLKNLPCYKHLAPNLNEKVFVDMGNALGAGTVISTTTDLIQWGYYLFKDAPAEIREVLLKNYGKDPDGDIIHLGLSTMHTNYLGDLIGHQGSIDSFSSFFGYAPESDTLIVMLSNSNIEANKLMTVLNSWLLEVIGNN